MTRRTGQVIAPVTTVSGVVLPGNPHRRHFIVGNAGADTAYLSLGSAAVASAGLPIPTGAIPIEVDAETIGDGVGLPIYAVTATGTTTLVFWVSQD